MAGNRANTRVALALFAVVPIMVGASFAAIPFYSWFCRVTGYAGTPGRSEADEAQVVDRLVTVSFDANTSPGMAWTFRPKQRSMTLKLGETGLAFFEAYNPTDKPLAGQAGYNVVPFSVGGYFDKIQCFCFTMQVLQPHERVEMPVTFYVDPGLLEDDEAKDVKDITLSYTMYPADLPEDDHVSVTETTTKVAAAPADRGSTIEQ